MTKARPFVVWCAGVHWDALRGTDRHLVTALSESADVLWVDPPLSVVRKFRPSPHGQQNQGFGRRDLAPGLVRLTVLVPPYSSRRGMRRAAAALTRAVIRRAVRRQRVHWGADVAALVVSAPEPLFGAVRDTAHVYFATDDFTAGAALLGFSAQSMLQTERELVSAADLLVGVSSAIVDRWDDVPGARLVLPNGCRLPADVTTLPPESVGLRLSSPMAAVVGQFSARIDLALLEAVADEGVSLLLVGPHDPAYEPARFQALTSRDNVEWTDQQPYERVAELLRAVHVGLTPYVDSEFNRASFPLKTLEYLAAGRAVVSTLLPAVDVLGTDQITTADSPAAFAGAVVERLAQPLSADLVEQRRALASQHTWEARATVLLDAVDGLRGVAR